MIYTTLDSPLGTLLAVGERMAAAPGGTALASLSFTDQRRGPTVRSGWVQDPGAFTAIADQLAAYFAGTLDRFDIRYVPSGSDFQRRVWATLDAIPYGATLTYGGVAARLGEPPSSSRAVGAAIGVNPLLVVRPCHRVVSGDGSLTGYAGGVGRKQMLLALEGAILAI